jgi:demethylmenaquinone methyltransferase/2-methoxy-6-polyprenyl-1,4-benzoquinol methylase
MPPITVDKSESRVRAMFAGIAGRYDLLNHLLSLNVDRYWRWRTVRKAPAGSGPVLDLCTGTGDLALAYYRAGRGQTSVVGADFCRPMLDRARAKGLAAGANGRLSFVEADAKRLPFDDESFQLVCVAFGLRNVSDTDTGLREMVRVCRPEGTVAVLEFSLPTWQPFRAIYGWYFRRVLPRIGQLLSRNSHGAYQYLPASVGEFPQGKALTSRMLAAGLREATHFPLTLGVATLYVGTK